MKISHRCLTLLVLALFCSPPSFAGTVYSNTTTDTSDTTLYSSGFTEMGDQIHLINGGNGVSATVQLFNAGAAGTFDAWLQFYNVGAPVGAAVGSAFKDTGVTLGSYDVLDLTFALGGLLLPQDVIFVVSLHKVSAGMDLGLNMYEPPTVGASDNMFMIADGAKVLTGNENVYFQLSATSATSAVPEPSTAGLLAAGLLAAGSWRKRRVSR